MSCPKQFWRTAVAGSALMLSAAVLPRVAVAQEVARPPADADTPLTGGAEVLTRGPVHEAFADPYAQDPEHALVVSREPPEPIDEIPPDVMPEGDDVEWIPGYWGWDDDRNDFIWISGVWRDMPPGQRWVPGAWEQTAGGYQWTPGFWTSADVEEVTYLPPPPPSQEEGPNSPAPDDDHFWVPGVWQYADNDYVWRPGYWAPAYYDWVWVPDRNIWTPYGYVYCPGFWDRSLPNRGVLFSPVFFPGYQYTGYVPRQVVAIGPLLIHLFVRPGYCHYYFGDYYGSSYAQFGIVPWLGVNQFAYYRYDPLFAFYQTGYFNGRGGFLSRISGWHHYYQQHPDFRPRHTLADARRFARQRNDADATILQQASLTQSIEEVRTSPNQHITLRDVAAPDRERIVRKSREIRDLQKLRRDHSSRRQRGEQADARIKLPKVERERAMENVPQRPDGDRQQIERDRGDLDELRRNRDRNREERPIVSPDESTRPQPTPERRNERDRVQPNPNRGQDRDVNREPRSNRRERSERQPELRRRGRSDMSLPDAPGGDRGNEVRRIPRPSEPIAPRVERRESRKPVAPRESQQRQPRSIEQNQPPVQQLQPGNTPRGGGRGDSGQARQQKPPRAQPQTGGGGSDRDRGGRKKP